MCETRNLSLSDVKFDVEKPKTRKGLSYILKSSIVESAMVGRTREIPVYLTFFTPQHFNPTDTSVFEAEYVPATIGGAEDRFHIRIGAVAGADRKQAEQLFLDQAMEPFVKFVEYQVEKTHNSTYSGRGFYVRWVNQELIF